MRFWHGIVVILTITLFVDYVSMKEENADLREDLDQFEMYYINNFEGDFDAKGGVLGLAYLDKGFITVWTRDRTIVEVLETCTHEYAHMNLDMGHNSEIRNLTQTLEAMRNDRMD